MSNNTIREKTDCPIVQTFWQNPLSRFVPSSLLLQKRIKTETKQSQAGLISFGAHNNHKSSPAISKGQGELSKKT